MIDCAHPASLARFWAAVLRWDPPVWTAEDIDSLAEAGIDDPEDDPVVFISDPNLALPRICFQRVTEGKAVKNRLHLDVNVDQPSEIAEFVRLGARLVSEHEGWTVLADPESNEFCAVPH